MKNKGFTLIELLAVIVILAIIALIATPIILNIIDDARNSADEESINMYGKSVQNAVATYLLNNPTDTDVTVEDIRDYIKIDNKNKEIFCTIKIKRGKVFLNNCYIDGNKVDYTYGDSSIANICKVVITSTNTGYDTTQTNSDYDTVETNSSYNALEIASEIDCNGEHFFVIDITSDNVTMLAAQNITTSTSDPEQSASAGTTPFASSNYWGNITLTESLAYVYNEESLVYDYVDAYKTKLSKMGINVVSASIPSYSQISKLGLDYETSYPDYSWVNSSSYWIGNAVDSVFMSYVSKNSIIFDMEYTKSTGVRPVITLPISEIDY